MSTENAKVKELESKIYGKYYELNPDGDARFGLWPAVNKAKKKDEAVKALEELYEEVEQDLW